MGSGREAWPLLKAIVFIAAAIAFSSAIAFALPNKIPLNGRLVFSNDTDVNGTANFTFKVYNNKTGGSLLWQETQQNLTVRRGLLSTYLGNNTPINLSFDENYFLEIVVNGETVEPRFDLGTQGYSFTSNQTSFLKNETRALGDVIPLIANVSSLGSNAYSWLAGYFTNLFVRELNATGNIFINTVPVALQSNITSVSSAQSSDNITIASNLTATGARIGGIESKQSSNNNTLTDSINAKANLTTANNFTSGEWHGFGNASVRGQINATSINISGGISCGMITGGSDSNYCADATGAGGSEDNTTLTNLITANNNTLTNLKANLTTNNNFTGIWNYFANLTANIINATGSFFVNGVDLLARINSNNQTIADNLTSTGTRIGNLESKQSADNTTLANNLTSTNARIGNLDSRQSSDNTTLQNWVNGVDAREAANNNTQNNLIAGNNNTLYALLGQKLNLTGGILSSLLSILGASNANNLSLNVNNTLYVNASLDRVGVGTSSPSSKLDVSGTLTVEGINVTGRQVSDNTTLAGNLTSTNTRIGNLESKQSSDNATLANNISTTNTRIGNLETKQSSDNTTLSDGINLKANLTTTNNFTSGQWHGLGNVSVRGQLNASSINISGGISCGMITGGSDGDYCVDSTGAGAESDNTTQENKITGNNNTLTAVLGQKLNLTGGTLSSLLTIANSSLANNLSFNASGLLYVNKTGDTGYVGIFTTSPNAFLHVNGNATIAGTLFLDGFNLSARLSANNQTLSDRITSENTTIAANLSALANRIATQESNNNTQADAINAKANLTTTNNFTSGQWHGFGNISTRGQVNASSINISGGISCGMLTGGSDTDFCVDASAAGGTEDNTTQENKITGNNNTLTAVLGQKLNLTGGRLQGNLIINSTGDANSTNSYNSSDLVLQSSNVNATQNMTLTQNITLRNIGVNAKNDFRLALMFNGTELFSWLYNGYYGIGTITPASFLHVNGNATIAGSLFLDGFNVSARLSGNNQTLSDRITSENTTIAANLSSIGTRIGNLETKQSGDNTTVKENLSTTNTRIGNLETKQSSDNTTLTNLKLSLSGGTMTGLLAIGNISATNNLSLNVSGALYVNSSIERVGIGTTNPSSRLDVSGTLTVEGINVTGRQIADNTTTSGRITSENTTIAANLSSTGTRIGNLESKQASDNTTIKNIMVSTSAVNNFTAAWNWFANITTDIVNVTTGLFSGSVNYITRINSNNQTIADNLSSTGTRIGNLESKQSSDNTTISGRITSENTTIKDNLTTTNTRIGNLETKESGDNTTQADAINTKMNQTGGSYQANLTVRGLFNVTPVNSANNLTFTINDTVYFNASSRVFNVTTGISCGMITGGSDGDYCVDSTGAGAESDNTTQANLITGNNNTLTAVLGQKLNLTGGRIQGNLIINSTGDANSTNSYNSSDLVLQSSNVNATQNMTLTQNITLRNIGVNAKNDFRLALMFNDTEFFSWLYNGYYGIGTITPASFLHVNGNATIAGSLFLDGFNVSLRISSNNQTIADNLTSTGTRVGNLESKQSSDNTTISGRITSENTTIKDNLTTTNTRVGNLETKQSGDNTTVSNRFGGDNTTQANLITGNNNTLNNLKLNLAGGTMTGLLSIGNVSATNNLSLNVSGALYVNSSIERVGIGTANPSSRLDVSGTLTVEGINVTGRQISDNTTTSGRITSENTTIKDNLTATNTRVGNLETKESGDNTTQADAINTKMNQTGGSYQANLTVRGLFNVTPVNSANNLTFTINDTVYFNASSRVFNVTTGISCGMITGGSDGDYCVDTGGGGSYDDTTINQTIGQKANQTEFVNTNTTVFARINGNNQTLSDLISANNQTLTNLKLSLSGGTLTGLLAIGNVSAVNNLSLNVSGALYVNSSIERVGIGTTNPSSRLDVSGTLTVEGVNVTGRQSSDNTTIKENLSTTNARIGNLETKESGDNTTLNDKITANNQTLTNIKANLTTFNNFTAAWNQFQNATLDILNASQVNASRITVTTFNATGGISCGMITGGSDGDYCVDTGGGGASPYVNQTGGIYQAINLTLIGMFNVTPLLPNNINNLTFALNDTIFFNITNGGYLGIGTANPKYKLEVQGNISAAGTIFASAKGGLIINVTGRQESDNQTISDNLTSTNTRIGNLESKQSSDNTTIKDNLTSTGTRIGNLETKESGDNTTQADAINTKMNQTGGTYIGNFTLLGLINFTPRVADTNNLTFVVNDSLFFNRSQWGGFLGLGTANPVYKLDVRGNISASGSIFASGKGGVIINVTGRQESDNQTIMDNLTATVNRFAGDNTTQNDKITGNNNTVYGSLGAKFNQSGGNITGSVYVGGIGVIGNTITPGTSNITILSAYVNVTANVSVTPANAANNNSAILFYDTNGVCSARMYYNGTHFVIDGCS